MVLAGPARADFRNAEGHPSEERTGLFGAFSYMYTYYIEVQSHRELNIHDCPINGGFSRGYLILDKESEYLMQINIPLFTWLKFIIIVRLPIGLCDCIEEVSSKISIASSTRLKFP